MKFTQSHIDDYFDRINLPFGERQKFKDPAGGTEPKSQLQSLTTLLHHHLAAVPFENTSLHYSRHRPIELSIKSLFQKIVHRRLGGYCTQVNTLFSELLIALGYHLYTTAARINQAASATSVDKECPSSRFGTLSHMLLVVTINGQDFLVDAAFGPNAPTNPVPMRDGEEFLDLTPRMGRLVYKPLDKYRAQNLKYWRLQFRESTDQPWMDAYAFPEVEFTGIDGAALDRHVMTDRRLWFMVRVMAFRHILDEQSGKPAGFVMLWENQLRHKFGGKYKVSILYSESDRILALEKWFNIVLNDDEKEEIRDTVSYLYQCREPQEASEKGRRPQDFQAKL